LAGDTSVTGAGNGGNAAETGCNAGNGGFGGTQGGAGGAGNSDYGNSGARGEGGSAPGGGAGGGGYFGGGGGGDSFVGGVGGPGVIQASGGAGSSYWIQAATHTSMAQDATGVPEVTITPVGHKALVLVTDPGLSGPHKPGTTERVTKGTWRPAPSKVTYQWYLGRAKVKGATKSAFTVPGSTRKGTTIRCVITASKARYASGRFTTHSVKIT
jgi:hypothetical protein